MSTLLLTDARPQWKKPTRKASKGAAIVKMTSRYKVRTMVSDAAMSDSVRETWPHILWDDFLWIGRLRRRSGTDFDEADGEWAVSLAR